MQFRHLKTFAAVASTLNFTRAAEQVHLAQSSVTEQIQALETELGTPLFDRSRRKLSLTGAGRRLLEYAEDILTLVDEARSAVADAAGLAAGSVAIGGLETICASRLPPLLAEFSRAHPSIALQLKVATSGELRNAVRCGAVHWMSALLSAVFCPMTICAAKWSLMSAWPSLRLSDIGLRNVMLSNRTTWWAKISW